jgi:hypothetical protein
MVLQKRPTNRKASFSFHLMSHSLVISSHRNIKKNSLIFMPEKGTASQRTSLKVIDLLLSDIKMQISYEGWDPLCLLTV